MDQGPGGWDQAESDARGVMQVRCVSLTSTEGVTPLVSSTAVVEIQQGDVVQLQVKHCWGAIVVRHEFWAVT